MIFEWMWSKMGCALSSWDCGIVKNEFMNRNDLLHAGSDAITFGQTDNPTLHL